MAGSARGAIARTAKYESMKRLLDEISQFLQVFASDDTRRGAGRCWQPAADIYRTRGGWLVKLELAGVRREDLEVTAQGRWLSVRGSRRDATLVEGLQHHSLEIAYSEFERRLDLPCDLDQAEISAEFQDGMLIVRIATAEASS